VGLAQVARLLGRPLGCNSSILLVYRWHCPVDSDRAQGEKPHIYCPASGAGVVAGAVANWRPCWFDGMVGTMSLFDFFALCWKFILENPLLVFGSVILTLYAVKKTLEQEKENGQVEA